MMYCIYYTVSLISLKLLPEDSVGTGWHRKI